jgi:hypothetical protein
VQWRCHVNNEMATGSKAADNKALNLLDAYAAAGVECASD